MATRDYCSIERSVKLGKVNFIYFCIGLPPNIIGNVPELILCMICQRFFNWDIMNDSNIHKLFDLAYILPFIFFGLSLVSN